MSRIIHTMLVKLHIAIILLGLVYSDGENDKVLSLETVEEALSSQTNLMTLYKKFTEDHGLIRCRKEHPHRLKLFRKVLEKIKTLKLDKDITWEVGLTGMSDLTDDETHLIKIKSNSTADQMLAATDDETLSATDDRLMSFHGPEIPTAFDWRDPYRNGKTTFVNPIHLQHEGSCWARSAVVPLECLIKKLTGHLLELSVQEVYDTTYDGKNHWEGGRAPDAWRKIKETGRLGLRSEIPDRPGSKPTPYIKLMYEQTTNIMEHFKLTSFKFVARVQSTIAAIYQNSPVALTMETEKLHFKVYMGKPYYNSLCDQFREADHAMVMVGYTEDIFIIRNTWGVGWGDMGYLLWERHHEGPNCGMFKSAAYPTLEYVPKLQKREEDQERVIKSNL